MDGGVHPVPVGPYAFAGVQAVAIDSGITGSIEIKKSISGNGAHAVSFGTAVQPNLSTFAIIDSIDVRDVGFLHIQTTDDGDRKVELHFHFSEA